jgi:hypothetical protein
MYEVTDTFNFISGFHVRSKAGENTMSTLIGNSTLFESLAMIYFPQVRAREVLTICGGSSDHHEIDVRVQGQPWILSPPVKSESDFADSVFDLFRNAVWFTCGPCYRLPKVYDL